MTRVLVTGFEPFDGAAVNPSQKLVEALASDPPDDVELATAVLPVAWERATDELLRALEKEQPELVVCFGQADGRADIEIERFALNFDEGSDEEGEERRAETSTDAPVAYRCSLPVDAIVAALRGDDIPAAPSRDAGGFLCNHVFYVLMRVLADERTGVRGGFVHVPLLPEQALDQDEASMPLETLVRAGQIIVATA
jgi:pyroglutamyl-peptidase